MELEWNSQILSLCSDQMKTPFLLLLLRLLHIVTHGTNFIGILARTSAASSALISLSVLHWFQSSEGRKRRSWSSYYTCCAPHFPLQSRWELSRFFTPLSFLDMLSERDVPTWKERVVKKQDISTEIRICQQ
jgi:hypothetical protein